jgi:hypothetical protein
MTTFQRRKNPTQTRIVRRPEPRVEQAPDTAGLQAVVTRVLDTRRWEPTKQEFKGFGSPPGKF